MAQKSDSAKDTQPRHLLDLAARADVYEALRQGLDDAWHTSLSDRSGCTNRLRSPVDDLYPLTQHTLRARHLK